MTAWLPGRLDILPPGQRALWPSLRAAADMGFVLYGGTAVALRLGHRVSVDFDFFSDAPLDRTSLAHRFEFVGRSIVLQDEPNALTLLVPTADSSRPSVKVSFFGSIAFGRVGVPDLTADGVLQVASLDDLMATKVKVVLQRAEAKDYRDVAAMIRCGTSLAAGIASARLMYAPHFQPSESLKALVYFADGDLQGLPVDDRRTLVDAVNQVRDLPQARILARHLAREA